MLPLSSSVSHAVAAAAVVNCAAIDCFVIAVYDETQGLQSFHLSSLSV